MRLHCASLLFLRLLAFRREAFRTRMLLMSRSQIRIKQSDDATPNDGGTRLVDATPLFAGTVTVRSSAGPSDEMSCCCSAELGHCEIIATLDCAQNRRSYHKWHDTLRSRCLVEESTNPWVVNELRLERTKIGMHPQVWSSIVDPPVATKPYPELQVFFIRHGLSFSSKGIESNEDRIKTVRGDLKNGMLDWQGQDQATTSQRFFLNELADVNMEQVQLAASMSSDAYDSLILSTAEVWNKWTTENDAGYVVHQVPALMEVGDGTNACRDEHLLDFAPVRWCDSSLSVSAAVSAPSGCQQFFQGSDENKEPMLMEWLTAGAWQVQAGFPKITSRFKKCEDVDDQVREVAKYLKYLALIGKTHAVLSSHGDLMKCFFKLSRIWGFAEPVSEGGDVNAAWLDASGHLFNLEKRKVPHGATVSFKLQVHGDDEMEISSLGLRAPGRGYPSLGLLEIKVMRAIDLENKDTGVAGDVSDPYLKFSFGGVSYRTLAIPNTLNPEWDFKYVADVSSPRQVVRLDVLDENVATDDAFLGSVDIPVKAALAAPQKLRTKLNGVEKGELELELYFTSSSDTGSTDSKSVTSIFGVGVSIFLLVGHAICGVT